MIRLQSHKSPVLEGGVGHKTVRPAAKASVILLALISTLLFTNPAGADKIRTAPIKEPSKTHYLGRASLELPNDFSSGTWSTELLWFGDSRAICIDERPFNPKVLESPAEIDQALKMTVFHSLRPSKQRFRPEVYEQTEDLSSTFGAPARFYSKALNGDCQERMALAVSFGPAYLLFEQGVLYKGDRNDQETLNKFSAAAKSWFIEQCRKLFAVYDWNGRNQAPPPGRLATSLGSIDLSGFKPEPLAIASVFFRPENKAYPRVNVVVTGFNGAAPHSGPDSLGADLLFWLNGTKREVAEVEVDGRKGKQTVKTEIKESGQDSYYEASWQDQVKDGWNNLHPKYRLNLYFSGPEKNIPYAEAVWTILLNSLKTIDN